MGQLTYTDSDGVNITLYDTKKEAIDSKTAKCSSAYVNGFTYAQTILTDYVYKYVGSVNVGHRRKYKAYNYNGSQCSSPIEYKYVFENITSSAFEDEYSGKWRTNKERGFIAAW